MFLVFISLSYTSNHAFGHTNDQGETEVCVCVCVNRRLFDNTFTGVESRCFAYDNNGENVKQYEGVSVRARAHERERRKKQNPEHRLRPEHVSITRRCIYSQRSS